MLDNLTQRLGRAMKALRGEARLTENNIQDALREVRLALLEADVALPVVKQFITAVRDKAVGQEVLSSLSPGQALVQNPEFSAWLVNRTPSRRWGDVEDLLGAAVFLASGASDFVNGHILYVDGGVTATL